jgi:hypothetical protein
MGSLLEENWFPYIAMSVVIIFNLAFHLKHLKNSRASNKAFLTKHPDAAKIFLTTNALTTLGAVGVRSVNNLSSRIFIACCKKHRF